MVPQVHKSLILQPMRFVKVSRRLIGAHSRTTSSGTRNPALVRPLLNGPPPSRFRGRLFQLMTKGAAGRLVKSLDARVLNSTEVRVARGEPQGEGQHLHRKRGIDILRLHAPIAQFLLEELAETVRLYDEMYIGIRISRPVKVRNGYRSGSRSGLEPRQSRWISDNYRHLSPSLVTYRLAKVDKLGACASSPVRYSMKLVVKGTS